MAGPNSSHWSRHWFHHFIFSAWRKRPLLLAAVMVVTLVLLVFQYHSVTLSDNNNASSDRSEESDVPISNKHTSRAASMNDRPASFPKRNLSATDLRKEGPLEGLLSPRGNADNDFWPSSHETGADTRPVRAESDPVAAVNSLRSSDLSSVRAGERNPVPAASGPFIPKWRVVHFDLKGAPPRVSYFKQILPLLKQAGANAILMEYEEMFPFWGELQSVASPAAYSKDDVMAILQLAQLHDFEVIPLVQTFGHLEFVLKLEQFRHLREVDQFPMALCPSKNESFSLVTSLIDQIMIFHPKAKWLHIGCDEVYHMGYCDKCRLKERDTIFLDHVTRVARYVREKYGVKPIIWDDMLRNMYPERMRDLGSLVEPMVWTYVRDVYRFIPYTTWSSFAEVFPNIWAAGAFKGAFGETLTVPNARMHLENNEAWLQVMGEQQSNFKGSFRGIAITGWQRYDHLANLCELLPAGLPSLVLDLLTVSNGKFDSSVVFDKFDKIMKCSARSRFYSGTSSATPDFDMDPFLWTYASVCSFPGADVFRLTQHTSDVIKRVNDYIYDVTVHKAWMTDYSMRHNMSNPFRVDEALSEYTGIYYSLTSLVREAEDALGEVFDKYTLSEWIEQNIYPYILKMEKVAKDGMELKKARTWPRRPLPPLPDLQRFLRRTSSDSRRSGRPLIRKHNDTGKNH